MRDTPEERAKHSPPKSSAVEVISASLASGRADYGALNTFRASLPHLPAKLVTAFVEHALVDRAPATIADLLVKMTRKSEPAVLAGLRARRTPTLVFLETLLAAEWSLRDGVAVVGELASALLLATDNRVVRRLSARPEVVEAARAALQVDGPLFDGFLALCCLDGSADSADGLLPWVERARSGRSAPALDALHRFGPLAEPGSAVAALLEISARAWAQRPSRESLAELFRSRGWPLLPLTVTVDAEAHSAAVWLGGSPRWAEVFVTRVADGQQAKRTHVENFELDEDALGLGPLVSPTELPAWLEAAEKRLGLVWNWDVARVSSKLPASTQRSIVDWLRARGVEAPSTR